MKEQNKQKPNFIIRHYRREDFDQFIGCVKSFYGEGYPYKEYLDADVIDQKIASGDFIMTVAQLDDGKIVSVVAAERRHQDYEGTVVLLLRNVLKEYREFGISSEQLNVLLDEISVRFPDIISIYADAMTHDTKSQNSLVHRGYTLTALRLMVYKNSVMVPSCNFASHTKMTQVIFSKCVKDKEIKITVPEKHKNVIADVYSKLGLSCKFIKGCDRIGKANSEIHLTKSIPYAKAELFINSIGNDCIENVKTIMSEFNDIEDFTYIVYLNMEDEASILIFDELEKLGFYFSGIMPMIKSREYMVLSNTEKCKENFEDIALADSNNFWIDYIQSNRPKKIKKEC